MYIVLYYTGTALTIAGVFTSLTNAQQYIGTQSASTAGAGTYYVIQTLSLQGLGAVAPCTPIPITAGQYTVIVGVQDALGNTVFFAYGAFSTLAQANQYLASRAFPGGCASVQVGTGGF